MSAEFDILVATFDEIAGELDKTRAFLQMELDIIESSSDAGEYDRWIQDCQRFLKD